MHPQFAVTVPDTGQFSVRDVEASVHCSHAVISFGADGVAAAGICGVLKLAPQDRVGESAMELDPPFF